MLTADSSTLILLAKAKLLGKLLEKQHITIPQKVYEESIIRGKEKGSPDSFELEKYVDAGKITIKDAEKKAKEYIQRLFNMHRGERDALASAYDSRAVLLCDDKKAISAAKVLKIKYATAINVLLELYASDSLTKPQALNALSLLNEFGWYATEIIQYAEEKIKC